MNKIYFVKESTPDIRGYLSSRSTTKSTWEESNINTNIKLTTRLTGSDIITLASADASSFTDSFKNKIVLFASQYNQDSNSNDYDLNLYISSPKNLFSYNEQTPSNLLDLFPKFYFKLGTIQSLSPQAPILSSIAIYDEGGTVSENMYTPTLLVLYNNTALGAITGSDNMLINSPLAFLSFFTKSVYPNGLTDMMQVINRNTYTEFKGEGYKYSKNNYFSIIENTSETTSVYRLPQNKMMLMLEFDRTNVTEYEDLTLQIPFDYKVKMYNGSTIEKNCTIFVNYKDLQSSNFGGDTK